MMWMRSEPEEIRSPDKKDKDKIRREKEGKRKKGKEGKRERGKKGKRERGSSKGTARAKKYPRTEVRGYRKQPNLKG